MATRHPLVLNGGQIEQLQDGDSVPAADKLAAARTISLSGDAAGSASFDGSGNVSIATTVADDSHNHVIGNVDGLQSALDGKAASSHTHSYAPVSHTHGGGDITSAVANATSAASCSGNAATATKLATARTISLTGDVTGSASFDGSANASITATVADDSHNHTIANVDGLQSELDGKVALDVLGRNVGASTRDPDTTDAHIILSNHANSPSTSYYWHITTTFYYEQTSTANRAQIAVQYKSGNAVYARSCYGGTWTAWVRCDAGNITVTAGNGLTGGGALSASRTLTLGTPGSCSPSTSNAATSTSHTHNITGCAPIPTSSALPVGTICVCLVTSGSVSNGSAISGSYLKIVAPVNIDGTPYYAGATQSGTWKNIHGATVSTDVRANTGLFVRTA